ncbi:MAG: rhamnogalacturonan acetylesterase [Bacteroidales bacterium]
MKRISVILLCFGLLAFTSHKDITIFLVGDSTMADKPIEDNPERGWGQMFPQFFNKDIKIENHAKNGRSTKSFIEEGRWDSVMMKVKKGDYVFIEFGHNDAKVEDPKRYAEAHTTYKDNLIRFIDDCKKRGATPILLTPIVRRKFDDNGQLTETHGDYPSVVREVAKLKRIKMIDMNEKSRKLVSEYGVEKSKLLYLHIEPGVYKSLPDGKNDDTHFSELGATKMAELVIEGLNEHKIKLVKYLNAK